MLGVGTVRELWRYPVKSLGGERLESVAIGKGGLLGDRLWALRDEIDGVITGAKRFPELLKCDARFASAPEAGAGPGNVPPVVVRLPDGSELSSGDPRIHDALSAVAGRKLTLCALRNAEDRKHYRAELPTAGALRRTFGLERGEPLPDLSMFPLTKLGELSLYTTPPGTYFDAYALHLVTTAGLRALERLAPGSDFDVRRFRPNIVVDTGAEHGFVELGWCGGKLGIGSFSANVAIPTVRCSMPSRAQRELGADKAVLTTIATRAERCFGVYLSVRTPGRIAVGDAVEADPDALSPLARWTRARAAGLKRLMLRAVAAGLPRG
jgi:uncharacterized protein